MAKQFCGEKTIEKLRNSGYSNSAIEDITYLAQRHRARVGKIEEALSLGYTPKQVDEIYQAAREFRQNPKKIQRFYDRFKGQGNLSEMIEKIAKVCRASRSEIPLHQAIPLAVSCSFRYKRDFNSVLENLEADYNEAQYYAKGLNVYHGEYGEYPEEKEQKPEDETSNEMRTAYKQEFLHQWGFV
jgi:hypothetical protein